MLHTLGVPPKCANNLDSNSASIEIEGVSGGGNFKNSVTSKEKHSYALYIQGTWWYQDDSNIISDFYTIKLSIKGQVLLIQKQINHSVD